MFGEIGPVILEKKMKMWKVYRQVDKQTDNRGSEKLTWALNLIDKKTGEVYVIAANGNLDHTCKCI